MQVEEINDRINVIKDKSITLNEKEEDTALQKAINNIVKKENYVIFKVNTKIVSTTGDSFLGVLYEVDIKGKTTTEEKETHLFMKIVNTTHSTTFIDILRAYAAELYIYKELSKVYASLQEEYKVPLEDRYEMIKFYDGCTQEVIALENMRLQGFRTYHRTEYPSLDYMELCLKELAKFHALSFVLENKRPTYFETHIKSIKTPMNFNDDWHNFIVTVSKIGIDLIQEKMKTKLIDFVNESRKKFHLHFVRESAVRCLCHGDYRPSNILMKIIDRKILKVIPIDYQLVYYGSPVTDFIYLIYTSTNPKSRKMYLPHLKDLYHDTLGKFLEHFNMRVEKVFPRQEFDRAYEDELDYGFLMAFILIPVLMSSEDSGPDVLSSPENVNQVNETGKERLLELIEEFVDLGFL